jgi:hypothetical protein
MRAEDADRLVPVAHELFASSQVLRRGDRRARSEMIEPTARARRVAFLWAGGGLLGLSAALFIACPWAGVYIQVMEGSRGLPRPEPIDSPLSTPNRSVPTAALTELQFGPNGLAALGFEPAGWFFRDVFGRMRIGAWRHSSRPEVAFIMFQRGGDARLRIVRRFADGAILLTSTRLLDLACPPPASVYVQVRKTRSAAELWAWHLEAEALFAEKAAPSRAGDERITRSPGDFTPSRDGAPSSRADGLAGGERAPMEVFMEIVVRWAWFHRAQRLWLLRLNPFRECWRMYWLSGMSLKQQIEEGWAVAPWLRHSVCLPGEKAGEENGVW